jgi:hypothetical protein
MQAAVLGTKPDVLRASALPGGQPWVHWYGGDGWRLGTEGGSRKEVSYEYGPIQLLRLCGMCLCGKAHALLTCFSL